MKPAGPLRSPKRIMPRQELLTTKLDVALRRHHRRWLRRTWLALAIATGLAAAYAAGRWLI